MIAAGIAPTHLDTHKHTHVLPPVASAVARLVREFGIRWVRKPFDFGGLTGQTSWSARLMRTQHSAIQRKLREAGAVTTKHFAGFALTGYLDEDRLLELVERLPEGVTELMCHPGFCREQLRASATRLMESREIELRALTSARVRTALDVRGVQLASFSDMTAKL